MPTTSTDFPILLQFMCAVESLTGKTMQPEVPPKPTAAGEQSTTSKPLPKGVVLGPDGKP